MVTKSQDKLLFGFRTRDSANGVTRPTVQALARALDMNETAVIHLALAKLASETLPAYERDDGPLTTAQIQAIQADADIHAPTGAVIARKSLFG